MLQILEAPSPRRRQADIFACSWPSPAAKWRLPKESKTRSGILLPGHRLPESSTLHLPVRLERTTQRTR